MTTRTWRWLIYSAALLLAGPAFGANATSKPTSKPAKATKKKAPKKAHHGHQGHHGHHGHHHGHHQAMSTSSQPKKGKGKKHLPPIDCPFAKKGINPHSLKPFKDINKYIAMLERKDRAAWQKPAAVVKALGLKGHEKIADVGAGSGYFSFRFAKVLPKGMVYAIDVEPNMLKYIHHNAMMKGIQNVQIVFAGYDNPKVPKDSDLVFICDVLHHVRKRTLWLKRLFASLRSGTKVVVIEFKEGKLPKGPPPQMKIPKKKLIQMFTKAGFKKHSEKPKLLPYQEFLVFQKP